MKIVISTIGTFHYVDLAVSLANLGHDVVLYSGYPKWILQARYPTRACDKHLCVVGIWFIQLICNLPLKFGILPQFAFKYCSNISQLVFDLCVFMLLPPCDIFVGQARVSLKAGRKAQKFGAKYICDVGSTHIDNLVKTVSHEYELRGLKYNEISASAIEREKEEYETCDYISVVSTFVLNSFKAKGVNERKLLFNPLTLPLAPRMVRTVRKRTGKRRIIFVGCASFRKGLLYLISALRGVEGNWELLCVGSVSAEFRKYFSSTDLCDKRISFLGHMNKSEVNTILEEANVLVLPSIEDGFGMVMIESLAAGCPVVASSRSGGADLIEVNHTGVVVDPLDIELLREAIVNVCEWWEERPSLREDCIKSVREYCIGDEGESRFAVRYSDSFAKII